jgi:hypothetical protein
MATFSNSRKPFKSAFSFLQLSGMTIGTLIAKEESEQEGYKE